MIELKKVKHTANGLRVRGLGVGTETNFENLPFEPPYIKGTICGNENDFSFFWKLDGTTINPELNLIENLTSKTTLF